MSMPRIRERYGVPAKRGGRVIYSGEGLPRTGTIVGSTRGNDHLRIRLDGDNLVHSFHPTWELKYMKESANDQ